jgi:hypothetical protein
MRQLAINPKVIQEAQGTGKLGELEHVLMVMVVTTVQTRHSEFCIASSFCTRTCAGTCFRAPKVHRLQALQKTNNASRMPSGFPSLPGCYCIAWEFKVWPVATGQVSKWD